MTEPGVRERKKQQTWQALHRAALALATEHGVDCVTTEQIAAAAGVSPRTFFNYFPTKEAALVGLRPDTWSPMIEVLRELPTDVAPLEAMFAASSQLISDFNDDPELWAQRRDLIRQDATLLRLASARNADVEHHLADLLAERLGMTGPPDPYPALVVGAAMAAIRATIQFHGSHVENESPLDTLRRAFDMLAEGLPVPQRIASPGRE